MLAWLRQQNEEKLFLPAVVFWEIEAGLEMTCLSNPPRVAALEAWLRELERFPRIVSMDASAFREWARLTHNRSSDLTFDAMIAAMADIHGLTVATRNVRDFVKFPVAVVNPFEFPQSDAGRGPAQPHIPAPRLS